MSSRGRPPRPVCSVGVALLRRCGWSWHRIERETGVSRRTLHRRGIDPVHNSPRCLTGDRWGTDVLASRGGER